MSEREIIMKEGWKRNRGKRMMKLQKDAWREVRNSCKKNNQCEYKDRNSNAWKDWGK